MNPITARVPDDEPVTEAVLAQAVARGRQRRHAGLHATTVRYLADIRALLVGFADDSAVVLPVLNYPELAVLEPDALERLEVGFGGNALCLQERDLHVSIAGLVLGSQPLMDMANTVVAADAARRNRQPVGQALRPSRLGRLAAG